MTTHRRNRPGRYPFQTVPRHRPNARGRRLSTTFPPQEPAAVTRRTLLCLVDDVRRLAYDHTLDDDRAWRIRDRFGKVDGLFNDNS